MSSERKRERCAKERNEVFIMSEIGDVLQDVRDACNRSENRSLAIRVGFYFLFSFLYFFCMRSSTFRCFDAVFIR